MIDLYKIKNPNFLKDLSNKELNNLAKDIREFILENVSKTGGHLSSNLGVVELTIALHYVFNNSYDKLIFDVGHQMYTHKI
ncbi:MAG: 1-deoxy-D-xylulose-5-phosphate synthase N-terminal domain-containing protein, partial [Anaeroplasmataceae bacterium]